MTLRKLSRAVYNGFRALRALFAVRVLKQEKPAQPILSEREVFWAQYLDWLATATTEELEQLEQALANFTTTEAVSLSRLMKVSLKDEQRRRQLPESLVSQLEAANWPAAQAAG